MIDRVKDLRVHASGRDQLVLSARMCRNPAINVGARIPGERPARRPIAATANDCHHAVAIGTFYSGRRHLRKHQFAAFGQAG